MITAEPQDALRRHLVPYAAPSKSKCLMPPINHFDLRNFDLNLLVAFDALMEECSVTRAAARLRVQQPAMSHSLATLRALLDDELFVRVGPGMRPTARARAVAPVIRGALEQMQGALRRDSAFDPGTATRTFRLGFSSDLELVLIPDLTALLRRVAPGLSLLGRTVSPGEVRRLLDEGVVDLAVGCFEHSVARQAGETLFEQSLACCFDARRTGLTSPVSRDAYLDGAHAVVTLNDTLAGCLNDALDRVGATLNIAVAAGEFLTVLSAAAEAPLLATLPARMARRYASRFGLTVSPVPLPLDVPDVAMVWATQAGQDVGNTWLREQVRRLLTG